MRVSYKVKTRIGKQLFINLWKTHNHKYVFQKIRWLENFNPLLRNAARFLKCVGPFYDIAK